MMKWSGFSKEKFYIHVLLLCLRIVRSDPLDICLSNSIPENFLSLPPCLESLYIPPKPCGQGLGNLIREALLQSLHSCDICI